MLNHLKLLKTSALALAISTSVAIGHEFWIDPLTFSPGPGVNLTADLRVGEAFNGSPYAYVPRNFTLFEVAQGARRVPVEGRMGDRPALDTAPLGDGLNVVLHVTRDYDLKYKDYETFVNFVRHKDAEWAVAEHEAAGTPDIGIVEIYSRYAKSLIAVGDGAGSDRNYGLLTEIVALANPYTDDLSSGMPVQVFYDGKVRADTQVELFARDADGAVEVTLHRTDDQGIAVLPVRPGMRYMADAVVLRRAGPANEMLKGAEWESLWANLTFATAAAE